MADKAIKSKLPAPPKAVKKTTKSVKKTSQKPRVLKVLKKVKGTGLNKKTVYTRIIVRKPKKIKPPSPDAQSYLNFLRKVHRASGVGVQRLTSASKNNRLLVKRKTKIAPAKKQVVKKCEKTDTEVEKNPRTVGGADVVAHIEATKTVKQKIVRAKKDEPAVGAPLPAAPTKPTRAKKMLRKKTVSPKKDS